MLTLNQRPDEPRPEAKTDDSGPLDGRRIYIHNYSLRCLARHSTELAGRIATLLAEVRAAKIVHHHVVESGVELGLVRESVADGLAQFDWHENLSGFFHAVGYQPCFPAQKATFLELLGPEEKIVASCSESGYYTFATGIEASSRMFADDDSIPSLQKSLNRGDGPADLTMIRGNSLALVDESLGTGRVGYSYYSLVLRSFALTDVALDEIDEAARATFIQQFQARVAAIAPQLTTEELRVCDDALSAMRRSFERIGSLAA